MNWFNRLCKFSGLDDMLQSLGVSEDVQQFILSQPNDYKQYYVNAIRQNPQMTVEDLQNNVQLPQQTDPYFDYEKEMASHFPSQAQKWILVNLKQARNSRLDLSYDDLLGQVNDTPYYRFWTKLKDWHSSNELTDFLRMNPNYDLANRSFEQVKLDIEEWHRILQGKGEGRMYSPTQSENIVYGPNWQNDEFDGWTIQQITDSNDLLAEGNFMNHCVGGFCRDVEEGNTKIFSLRDPQNKPHVTIETNPDVTTVDQIQGANNEDPKTEYRPMIKEWMDSMESRLQWNESGEAIVHQDTEHIIEYIRDMGNDTSDDMGVHQYSEEYKHTNPSFINTYGPIDWHDILHDLTVKAEGNDADILDDPGVPKIFVETAYEHGKNSLLHLLTNANLLYDEYSDSEEVENYFIIFLEDIMKEYERGVNKGFYPPYEELLQSSESFESSATFGNRFSGN